MRGEGVHAQSIKTVHEEVVKKWQNSVHVVVECPLCQFGCRISKMVGPKKQDFLAKNQNTDRIFS